MKNFPSVSTAIRENLSITNERVHARIEWNLNRYFTPTVTNDATSTAIDDFWNSWGAGNMFPLSSLTDVNKWGTGIAYIINDPNSSSFYKFYDYARMTEATRQSLPARYYYIDKDVKYKYWASPVTSSPTISGGSYPLSASSPKVDYGTTVSANKMVLKFNTHITKPVNMTIEISTNGSSWTTIATNPAVPSATGVLELWAPTGAGAWTTTPVYYHPDGTTNNLKTFRYVRVNVTSLDRRSSRLEMLEISPRIEMDLTDIVEEFNVESEMSDDSNYAPVGRITANTGSISLSNTNRIFDKGNASSPISSYMDEFAVVRIYADYSGTKVPLCAPMLTNEFNFNDSASGTISLVDYSRLFQETTTRDVMLKNYRATSIIWTLLDMIGFKDVKILESTPGETPVVEYFWCSKEDKVWEVLSKLCRDFQISMHIDDDGVLRVMSKEYIYSARATTWTFRETPSGNEKPDIIDYSPSIIQASNKISVKYKAINSYNLSGANTQIFWQAPETYTIGAAQLTADILTTDDYVSIRADKPELMPRNSGAFRVDGETLEYTHKEYRLNTWTTTLVADESDWFRAIEANNGKPPVFTGRLKLKARAKVNHRSGNWRVANEYRIRRVKDGSPASTKAYPQGARLTGYDSLNLSNPLSDYGTNPRSTRLIAVRDMGGQFNRAGFKFKINGNSHGCVGIVLYPQGTYDHKGYYFQIKSLSDPSIDKNSSVVGQCTAFRVEGDGTPTQMNAANPSKTTQTEVTGWLDKKGVVIKPDTWHWMEVIITKTSNNMNAFAVYVDGRCVRVFLEPTSGTPLNRNNWAGFFCTAGTTVSVAKFFSIDYPSGRALRQLPSSIKSWYPDNEWLMSVSTADPAVKKVGLHEYRYNMYLHVLRQYKSIKVFVDEFSGNGWPMIREVLEEDFRYTVFPAKFSKLYHSNPNINVLEFFPGPMGAKVTIVNTSNTLQFLAKESGSYDNVPQSGNKDAFYIWGRAVFQMEPQTVEKTNEDIVARRGEQSIDLDSTWIQTRGIANSMATWIFNTTKTSRDKYELEIFGNPLIEVGDCVAISHQGIDAGTFTVAKVDHSWDKGLETKVSVIRTS